MVNFPENIEDWTIGTIIDILHEGYYETDTLEFKEELSTENQRIARTSCAFANTNGGYIIIGISNDRTKDPLNRILGLGKSEDNVVKVVDQLKNIIPEIDLEKIQFKKSPIPLHNGKEIIILYIHKSNFLHQYEDKFYKRLQGKNEPMPYDEIKNKFIISRRNNRALEILTMDLKSIKNMLRILTETKEDIVTTYFKFIGLLETDGIKFFLYNQSYFHNVEIQNNIIMLLRVISLLQTNSAYYQDMKETSSEESLKEIAKKENTKTFEELVTKEMIRHSNHGLEIINTVNTLLDLKLNENKAPE